MAMTEVARATVTIIPNMQGAQQKITEEFTEAGKKGVEGIQTAIEEKASSMKKGMLTLAGAGTAAIAAFGVSAIKTGSEFEASMSQVAATLGLTTSDIQNNVNGAGDTFNALRDKAKEMGAATNFSASEAAEGLNILAMSGYDAEQSMAMLEDVLHLSAAGSMDMASAAAYVAGTMKGFNDSTKDSGYYADLMAKGATLANTSVSQLGDAMSSGAAGAASYGQTADSMTVSLLRLAEQGEVGAAAGTALSAAMKDLFTPSDQAKAALEELGVAAYDSSGNARDFNDVVNDLSGALSGMSAEEANAYKQTIFGIQGLNAYNKMTVTGVEKQKEWKDALAGASEGAGEASTQYDTMTDNLQGDFAILGSAFDGFKTNIYEKIEPAVRSAVQFITKLIDHMDVIGPVIAGVSVAFGVFAVAINIGSIIKGVTTAFKALNLVLAANPIGIVVAAIAGLVVGIIALWNNCEGFRTVVINVWEAVKTTVQDAVEAIKQQVEALKQKWEEAKQSVANMVGNVISEFDALKSSVKEKWESIKKSITDPIDKAKESIRNAIDSIKGFFDVKLEFPHINLPHFKIYGGEVPWGLGGKGYPPSIDIEWYAKAMGNAMILTRPTIFGEQDGKLLAGGEAGTEVVAGANSLMQMIRSSLRSELAEADEGNVQQVNFYIYGERGQSVDDIADAVARKLYYDVQRKRATA